MDAYESMSLMTFMMPIIFLLHFRSHHGSIIRSYICNPDEKNPQNHLDRQCIGYSVQFCILVNVNNELLWAVLLNYVI